MLVVYAGAAKLQLFGGRWLLAFFAWAVVREVLLPCIPVVMKMVLLGQVVPGRYPLWGDFYVRWFLVRQAYLFFTPGVFDCNNWLRRVYLRALGARIAQGVQIGSLCLDFFEGDLLTVAGGTCLDKKARILCSFLDGGRSQLCLSAVNIGADCMVGYDALLVPGTCLESRVVAPPCSSSHELRLATRQSFKTIGEPGLWYVILGYCAWSSLENSCVLKKPLTSGM